MNAKTKPGVSTPQELEQLLDATVAAQRVYSDFTQDQVDRIFRAAALAANQARIPLAQKAVTETRMGVVEDKVIKNHFASEFVYNKYREEKTCGVLEEDLTHGITRIAEPLGIIAGIIPTTNPTSTVIFKALLALKTRNAIVFSPHPRAKECTIMAARIILDAAIKAGAPQDIIGWIEAPSLDLSKALMTNPRIALILATGGPGMVKAAYSSGRPAVGVGAGNTPALIDEKADIKMAVNSILLSKTFDNGMICASEQTLIVLDPIYAAVKKELEERGAFLVKGKNREKLGAYLIVDGHLNPKVVGQKASDIAKEAGFAVPENTKVLIAEANDIDTSEPFAYEKLSPILGLYKAKNYTMAVDTARRLVEFGGMGHTAALYTDPSDRERVRQFSQAVPTARILVNTPSSQGAIGDIYNFKLEPSLTLGCGSWGGNSVSENVGVKHLINIKTLAERRENMLWYQIPAKFYHKPGCLPLALRDWEGKKRAFLVTDKPLQQLGMCDNVTEILDDMGIDWEIFSDVEPDPTLTTCQKGAARMEHFQPDLIIAMGGGSPMDAAKIMHLLYEHPEAEFTDLAMRFMDIRKRISPFPKMGIKANMVAIPTTSGTGSEVTPFAVVTDEVTGTKYPLADYELTPDMAIVDAELVMSMPATLAAYSGIDAMVHALEAVVSVLATEYTTPPAMEALRLLFRYLPESYKMGAKSPEARIKVHNAATLAGMAFANAFLGICHSMAHKMGAAFHIPHGLANAFLIIPVIRYNASNAPTKMTPFSQYAYPQAAARYAEVARSLGVEGKNDEESIENLIDAITKLKEDLGIPNAIKDYGITKEAFEAEVDQLAVNAFDDQCTGANPRFPLIDELKAIYWEAYNGA